jgi:hypothetical protein
LASWGRVRERGATPPPLGKPSAPHTSDAHSPALPETWHHRLCVQLTLLTASRLPRRRRSSDPAQSARRALSLPDGTDPRACRRGCRRSLPRPPPARARAVAPLAPPRAASPTPRAVSPTPACRRVAASLAPFLKASRLPAARRSSDPAQSARRALSLPDATDPRACKPPLMPRCRKACRRCEKPKKEKMRNNQPSQPLPDASTT